MSVFNFTLLEFRPQTKACTYLCELNTPTFSLGVRENNSHDDDEEDANPSSSLSKNRSAERFIHVKSEGDVFLSFIIANKEKDDVLVFFAPVFFFGEENFPWNKRAC